MSLLCFFPVSDMITFLFFLNLQKFVFFSLGQLSSLTQGLNTDHKYSVICFFFQVRCYHFGSANQYFAVCMWNSSFLPLFVMTKTLVTFLSADGTFYYLHRFRRTALGKGLTIFSFLVEWLLSSS